MRFLKQFKELNKKSVAIAGGKGASLGEMLRAGIPVPDGFVVMARTFDQFIEETDINIEIDAELGKVNKNDINSVELASKVIQSLIYKAKMPNDIGNEILEGFKNLKNQISKIKDNESLRDDFLVAVRSSATAEDSSTDSWAGELDSFLCVTEKNLLESVKNCWASLFTPRAVFYRIEKGMSNTKVSVAVVVQKMIDSEISGITFTVHPVTQDKNQMIIEAGYGLGEAIVGGMITPDSYVISKKSKEILGINISKQKKMIVRNKKGGTKTDKVPVKFRNKQKLTAKQILELSDICIKIERHYKLPCDIEWTYQKGRFYIVQSRPITTL